MRLLILVLRPLFLLLDKIRDAGRRHRRHPEHYLLGKKGEDVAHRFAESKLGWKVIGRNYESKNRRQELDMIAVERNTLVVAEIKTRATSDVSDPIRAVDREKERHIGIAAKDWVRKATSIGMDVRFDAITVILSDPIRIEHHRDAFHPEILRS
ncbi:MAG: YraN family protein [Acidobacteria bacterium]|nr:YraN family protein [Acidobacteriota bacterium]